MAEDIASFSPAHQGWQNRTEYFKLTPPKGFYATPSKDGLPLGENPGQLLYKYAEEPKIKKNMPYLMGGFYDADTDGSKGLEGVTFSGHYLFVRGKRYSAQLFGMPSLSMLPALLTSEGPYSALDNFGLPPLSGVGDAHLMQFCSTSDIRLVYVYRDSEGKKWISVMVVVMGYWADGDKSGVYVSRMPFSGGSVERLSYTHWANLPGNRIDPDIIENGWEGRFLEVAAYIGGRGFTYLPGASYGVIQSNCSKQGIGFLCARNGALSASPSLWARRLIYSIDMKTGVIEDATDYTSAADYDSGVFWKGWRKGEDGETTLVTASDEYIMNSGVRVSRSIVTDFYEIAHAGDGPYVAVDMLGQYAVEMYTDNITIVGVPGYEAVLDQPYRFGLGYGAYMTYGIDRGFTDIYVQKVDKIGHCVCLRRFVQEWVGDPIRTYYGATNAAQLQAQARDWRYSGVLITGNENDGYVQEDIMEPFDTSGGYSHWPIGILQG